MLLSKWLPILLTGLGAAVMAGNIARYFKFSGELKRLRIKSLQKGRAFLSVYIALLMFFFLGYLAVGGSFFFPAVTFNNLLVAVIFFLGSVFVLIGIELQMFLITHIQKSNLEATQALITAIEARDKNLNGHSIHVARLSLLIREYLPRLRQSAVDPAALEYAALLHDIGKLGVPESILDKDAALTDEEWAKIREHPLIGKKILDSLGAYRDISEWVLCHHERCDGRGYLRRPLGEIPFPSRIIAVADTFSALTMTRSYRRSKSYDEAAAILRECRGNQLDGDIVDAFLRIPRDQVEQCKNGLAEFSGVR